jgi:hypothetical protein
MDDVANLSGIKPIELVYVQRVRLFLLGVTTLADISSSDGKTLCQCALEVNKNPRKPVFRSIPPSRMPSGIKRHRNLATDYTNVLRTH